MSEIMEKRAAGRAAKAALDAVTCIRRGEYDLAEDLLQEALADVRKAAAQRRMKK